MEYITQKFDNTPSGLKQKDEYTRQLAAQGYRIISEQIEQGHAKGSEQCCWALVCLPGIFLAARTSGSIVVTYGREEVVAPPQQFCTSCGNAVPEKASVCSTCGMDLLGKSTPDQEAALQVAEQKRNAIAKTKQAQETIRRLDDLLVDSLTVDYHFDWKSRIQEYPVAKPESRAVEPFPATPVWETFEPTLSLLDKLVPSLRERKTEASREAFLDADTTWRKSKLRYDTEKNAAAAEFLEAYGDWDEQRKSYEETQVAEAHAKQALYLSRDVTTLHEYWKIVSKQFTDAATFPGARSFTYLSDTRALVVQYNLPTIGDVPRVREVSYVEARKIFDTVSYPDAWMNTFYDQLIYKITMRTMYMLFQSDGADALDSIVFNGNIHAVDRATGHEVNPCVISVRASKAIFLGLNLAQVDPKTCFKRLKGLSSANMIDLEPVVPLASSGSEGQGA